MNENSLAIAVLCSSLCVGSEVKPLDDNEWGSLATLLLQNNLAPRELLEYSETDFQQRLGFDKTNAQRLWRLASRAGSIAFEISKHENMGIRLVTRADSEYPRALKKALGGKCPPLFYAVGELSLLQQPSTSYIGSGKISSSDIEQSIKNSIKNDSVVILDPSTEIGKIVEKIAISSDVAIIELLSDSLLRKMRTPVALKAMRRGKMLLLSLEAPDSSQRVSDKSKSTRCILAQATKTILVKTENGKIELISSEENSSLLNDIKP